MEEDVKESGRSKLSSAFQSPTFDRDASITVNEAVGSASISPSGRDVVLASRQGLHIIDLDSLYSPPRHLSHQTPWEVADVQWSPFASRYYWIVSTSNQRALVWNLEMSTQNAPIEHVLHAHSRAITDINFSAHHPDVLATCAIDSFVHCWDLRTPARPVTTFCDWFAGATQVKWNRQDSHILASSHDKYLRIWDDRKGAYPLKTMDAHATKIYGLDWNRTRSTGILTCSLDKTIKMWDYSKEEDKPERVIRTPFPVWRARHTPFGWGMLAMPQRGNHDLHLYDRRLNEETPRDGVISPVHSFGGHEGQVKEFLWRARGDIDDDGFDSRDFQLVSWGSDGKLILHRMQDEHLRSVGYEKAMKVRRKFNLTRKGAVYKTFRDEQLALQDSTKSESPSSSTAGVEQGLGSILRGAASPGMSKAPIPVARGWGDGGFMMSSVGLQTRSKNKKNADPIIWMKGVKMGRRINSISARQRSKSLILSSELCTTANWDGPESLGDEITQVGDRFKKVEFDKINVPARSTSIALEGPWGMDGKAVYIKLEVRFPQNYPEAAAPELKIEKTSSLSDETYVMLSSQLQSIADSHKLQKRACLEAVVSYLVGERGLEEGTTFLNKDEDIMYLNLRGEESSSDEEDGMGPDFNGLQFQDMDTNGTDILGTANANANVPLPKACGALWAEDGRLVCFFPPKEENKSLLKTIALQSNGRSTRNHKMFEGFGRLHADSPEPRNVPSSQRGEEDEDELAEWSTSSSSSDSSGGTGILADRLKLPIAWRNGTHRVQGPRSRSADGSQRTSGTGNRSAMSKPKTIVSLHDLNNFLPAKRSLAEEYVTFGDGPTVCLHNADVAARHGYQDIANVWGLVALILTNDVPLEIMPQPKRTEPIVVLARRALVRINRHDIGLDLSYDNPKAVADPELMGRVKWGQHPFASSWLIGSLFAYFEQLADVQMLAMLSCVLAEPAAEKGVSKAIAYASQEVPMSMESPAFSLDYFPSREVAWSLFIDTPIVSIPSSPGIAQTPVGTFGSAGSSNGPWGSDLTPTVPTTPHSAGTSPPMLRMRASAARPSAGYSFSTSPEYQHARRSNSSLASAFAASFLSRPFTMAASPSRRSRGGKDLSTSAPTSTGITWGTNTVFAADSASRPTYLPAGAYDEYDEGSTTEEDEPTTPDYEFKLTLKNQNQFDDEGCVSYPLLDVHQSWKYRAYREAYAHLLRIWGLPLQRSEVLKFNGLTSYFPNEPASGGANSFTIGKTSKDTQSASDMSFGPDFSVAGHSQRPWRNTACLVCQHPIAGLHKMCLDCQHVSHLACPVQWVEFEGKQEAGASECETGCGCFCAEHCRAPRSTGLPNYLIRRL
ncbi:hypothetical protein BJ546DRAFT_838247 [Cryomyces antarcticus]